MSDLLDTVPRFSRGSAVRGAPGSVSRDGGVFGAGVIHRAAVVTAGEAAGHDLWIDHDFLSDVAQAINSSTFGIKARFTHPSASSDGLGRKLGKLTDAVVVQDRVYADLHFQEASHHSPEGNLASYVMELAEQTPDDFGLSIAFERDTAAEDEHIADHLNESREFVSPAAGNVQHFVHARLLRLRAGDVVDQPAANQGLFSELRGGAWAPAGEALLSYAFGLHTVKPEQAAFGLDADRVKQFLARFLASHSLTVERTDQMAEIKTDPIQPAQPEPRQTESSPADAPPSRDEILSEFRADLQKYVDAFGSENGLAWLNGGESFETAQTRHIEILNTRLASQDAQIEELQGRLGSLSLGDEDGVDFQPPASPKKTLANRIRLASRNIN